MILMILSLLCLLSPLESLNISVTNFFIIFHDLILGKLNFAEGVTLFVKKFLDFEYGFDQK